MITALRLKNFKCYADLALEDCKRINVITGDNGGGKTAILEAIYLVSGYNVELGLRLRTWRGYQPVGGLPPNEVEEVVWSDLFYDFDTNNVISIKVDGPKLGKRELVIARRPQAGMPGVSQGSAPIIFTWSDAHGNENSQGPIALPDGSIQYPSFFQQVVHETTFLAAQVPIAPQDPANRLSRLRISQNEQAKSLCDDFVKAFPNVESISVETLANSPYVFAKMVNRERLMPLNSVSSGINRIMSGLTAVYQTQNVTLIDEVDTGIYYDHQFAVWRLLLAGARKNDSQIFVTTHSRECLENLIRAAEGQMDDIAFWRVRRENGQPNIQKLTAEDLKEGLEFGLEMR